MLCCAVRGYTTLCHAMLHYTLSLALWEPGCQPSNRGPQLVTEMLPSEGFRKSCSSIYKTKRSSSIKQKGDTNRDTIPYCTAPYSLHCCQVPTALYYTMLFYTVCFAVICYTIRYNTMLYYTVPYYTILYGMVTYYNTLGYAMLYYAILYGATTYYTIICFAMQWHDILQSILYYAIHCTVLCYAMLYYPILYYTIQYSTMLYGTMRYYALLC